MRRYKQGTLDFYCAAYAVVNALARLRCIDMTQARDLLCDFLLTLSGAPALLNAFMRNETDHYWVVRYLMARWCREHPRKIALQQPFSQCLLPDERAVDLLTMAQSNPFFLPEAPLPGSRRTRAQQKAFRAAGENVWNTLESWMGTPEKAVSHTAIFRFHRFMMGREEPIVSHWTTGSYLCGEVLFLHDSSGEENALHSLGKDDLLLEQEWPVVWIVPESVLLLQNFVMQPHP